MKLLLAHKSRHSELDAAMLAAFRRLGFEM
jgi:hypothetical protein